VRRLLLRTRRLLVVVYNVADATTRVRRSS
jgi:hypothetical protein